MDVFHAEAAGWERNARLVPFSFEALRLCGLRELRLAVCGRVSGGATTAMRLDPGLAWDPGLSSCLGPTLG